MTHPVAEHLRAEGVEVRLRDGLAGMIATNHLEGDLPLADGDDLNAYRVVDVREPDEFAAGHVPGAVSMPLSVMRRCWSELPSDRPLALYCAVGQRAYYALRFLAQHGVDVRHLSGGYTTYRARRGGGPTARD